METDDDQQHLEEGRDYSHPGFSSGTSLIYAGPGKQKSILKTK